MEIKRNFAKRIQELRIEEGLSINKLSKKIGIPFTTLLRLERGETDIKSEQIIILSTYFKVSTDYLLGLED